MIKEKDVKEVFKANDRLYSCPSCGMLALEIHNVVDDKHDDVYPVYEECLNCGYTKEL